ncbi:MAG TPA: leukotoxin LktA family filamentous adhesin, partial [Terriglobales bacterium]|nr:leukotoxin LktA family filamentous adhesin [Terriglobales bacterium]
MTHAKRWARRFVHALLHLTVVPLTLLSYLVQITVAQQIVVDGRTDTALEVRGNVTEVSTATVHGDNAFNSFRRFDVDAGNVVNLHLPTGTENLINIVRDERTDIHGVLNSVRDGRAGGNLYLINPHGLVVGADGVINAGALNAFAVRQEVADGLLDAAGNPSAALVQDLLDGNSPLGDGVIAIEGQINAATDVRLQAASVSNSGQIESGAVFEARQPDFADLVNVAAIEQGTALRVANGEIEIVASNDIENSGRIASEGSDHLDGGIIRLTAGRDLRHRDGELSVRGRGEDSDGGSIDAWADRDATWTGTAAVDVRGGDVSGDGGAAEISAARTVHVAGGVSRAQANDGRRGQVLIDPAELQISGEHLSDGADLSFLASERIVVAGSSVVSSRDIADGADPRNGSSQGDSG